MIAGVGIDIIEVERVMEKVNRDSGFRDKVFSPGEIAYCSTKKDGGQHYAARFAAKEAFLKATGLGLTLGHQLRDIEVVMDAVGKPAIQLHGSFAAHAATQRWRTIHLSMSHVQASACAVVIIEL